MLQYHVDFSKLLDALEARFEKLIDEKVSRPILRKIEILEHRKSVPDASQDIVNYSMSEMTKILNKKPDTIRKMASNEDIPSMKEGKKWLFPKDEVRKYLNDKSKGLNPSIL